MKYIFTHKGKYSWKAIFRRTNIRKFVYENAAHFHTTTSHAPLCLLRKNRTPPETTGGPEVDTTVCLSLKGVESLRCRHLWFHQFLPRQSDTSPRAGGGGGVWVLPTLPISQQLSPHQASGCTCNCTTYPDMWFFCITPWSRGPSPGPHRIV